MIGSWGAVLVAQRVDQAITRYGWGATTEVALLALVESVVEFGILALLPFSLGCYLGSRSRVARVAHVRTSLPAIGFGAVSAVAMVWGGVLLKKLIEPNAWIVVGFLSWSFGVGWSLAHFESTRKRSGFPVLGMDN